MISSFRDLEVWKRAHKLVLDVYGLTNMFPRGERFGMVSQIRRAAYSIPSNLAEGYGRRSTNELLQFIAIANGSAEELRYFLILSKALRYLSPEDEARLDGDITAIVQMLAALSRSLKARKAANSRNTGHESRITKSSVGVRA